MKSTPTFFKSKQNVILLVLVTALLTELFVIYILPFESKKLQVITFLLLLVPYIIAMLWIIFRNDSSTDTDERKETEIVQMFHFYDEKGDLKLSIRSDMVYLVEAADNYVTIFYLVNDKLEKMMIRNSLRNMEWRFADYGLIRCHRSYMVNIKRIQMVRCQDGEVMLDFGDARIPNIPVSKGYAEKVMGVITK
ncbi:MAG: LytTR family transcriptional regulator [Paludibacteraceae bacterium]|nr:LytTR family transcriptional regulator [Paludibacteraceae bacterium]